MGCMTPKACRDKSPPREARHPAKVAEARALAIRLGRAVRIRRHSAHRTQRELAVMAGVDQATISRIELGLGESFDLRIWASVADAVGLDLAASLVANERAAAGHRLIADTAVAGGWTAVMGNDETVLTRGADRIVTHVWDVVTSVDIDLDRLMASVRRESEAHTAGGRAAGLVVIPAAKGNRRRVSELRFELRETFTATGRAWYRCLIHPGLAMPSAPGILWAFRDYERLRPAPDLPGWIWIAVGDRPRYATGRRTRR